MKPTTGTCSGLCFSSLSISYLLSDASYPLQCSTGPPFTTLPSLKIESKFSLPVPGQPTFSVHYQSVLCAMIIPVFIVLVSYLCTNPKLFVRRGLLPWCYERIPSFTAEESSLFIALQGVQLNSVFPRRIGITSSQFS